MEAENNVNERPAVQAAMDTSTRDLCKFALLQDDISKRQPADVLGASQLKDEKSPPEHSDRERTSEVSSPRELDDETVREQDDKEYEKLVERLDGDSSDAGREYDKWLLTLASSALGLSFVFVKDLAPRDKPWEMAFFLYSAWAFLVLSTMAILINLQLRYSTATILLAIADRFYNKYVKREIDRNELWQGMRNEQLALKRGKFIRYANWLSLFFFLVSLLCLIGFIWANRPVGLQQGQVLSQPTNGGLGQVLGNRPGAATQGSQVLAPTTNPGIINVRSTTVP